MDDPDHYPFQGGTFHDVQAQPGYIKELGACAIWISPALEKPLSGHGQLPRIRHRRFALTFPWSTRISVHPQENFGSGKQEQALS